MFFLTTEAACVCVSTQPGIYVESEKRETGKLEETKMKWRKEMEKSYLQQADGGSSVM